MVSQLCRLLGCFLSDRDEKSIALIRQDVGIPCVLRTQLHAGRLRVVSPFSFSLEGYARDTNMALLNLKKKGDCSQSTRIEIEKQDRKEHEG